MTGTQLIVLVLYFGLMYGVKTWLGQLNRPDIQALIPLINVVCGAILGFFGLANFDVTTGTLSTLAAGGLADLTKSPAKYQAAAAAMLKPPTPTA